MRWITLCLSLLLPVVALGEVSIEWVEDTAGVSIAMDGADNVYTVSYEYNPAGDITITKRDSGGAFLWDAKYDQTLNSAWEKATWVATDHQGNAIVSGSLMSGYSNPVNAASILMKFSPTGELLWRRVYESSFDGSYTKKCLVDQNDNIYVLSFGGPQGPVSKVKKFSPDGSDIWIWFDTAGIGAPVNFKFTPDDAITITGRSIYGSINGYAKIDLDGNLVWSHPGVSSLTVGDADGDSAGNTYLVHGEYAENGGTVVRKLSPSGSLLWANAYPLAGLRVEVGTDDQPVVSGYPNPNTVGSSFIKIDGDGGVVWTNPDADGPYALLMHAQMIMDQDNNAYLAAGTMTEMAVCKVNADGSSAWTMTMPRSYAYALALGATGDVFVVGGTTVRLGQTLAAGLPEPARGALEDTYGIRCFPNPATTGTTIRYDLPAETDVVIGIYDLMGREVASLARGVQGPGHKDVSFALKSLAGGTYFYRLQVGTDVKTGKLSVVH
jgi:hypothetical protein